MVSGDFSSLNNSVILWAALFGFFPFSQQTLSGFAESQERAVPGCAAWLLEHFVFSLDNTGKVALGPPGVLISSISDCAQESLNVCAWV